MEYVDCEKIIKFTSRINLYFNSANRTLDDSASSFEMVTANTLITADSNDFVFECYTI
jgi:hypothetical protein